MTDRVAVANFRTLLEAEVAAGFLQAADIPYLIQSAEGMLHGPLGVGATILVRAADVELAREALFGGDPPGGQPARTSLVGTYRSPAEAQSICTQLQDAGLRFLTAALPDGRIEVFVRREHGDRARRVLERGREDLA